MSRTRPKLSIANALGSAALGPEAAKKSYNREAPTENQSVGIGAKAVGTKPGRSGKVNVTGYFNPAVKKSLLLIRLEDPSRTQQSLLAEALNDLFAKYDVPQTALLGAVDAK